MHICSERHKKRGADLHRQASSGKTFDIMKNKTCKIIILFRRRCKSTALRGHGKRPPVGEGVGGRPKGKRVAPLALIPEDVPIDLGVIATRIETAPHCRIINAALQPLRQVLKVAAFLVNISEIAFFICGNAGAVSNLYKTLIVV